MMSGLSNFARCSRAGVAPLVPALNGWAAPANRPKRLLLAFSGNGMVPERFWPKGTEKDFSFPVGNDLEPLTPFKNDLVVFRNLRRKVSKLGGAHERAMGALWTGCRLNPGTQFGGGGWPSGPSVDQIIARGLPKSADFASLEVGVQPFGPGAFLLFYLSCLPFLSDFEGEVKKPGCFL